MTSSAVSVTGKGVNGTTVWQQIFCGTRTNEIICYDVRQKFYDARLCAVFPLVPDLRQVAPPTEGSATPALCAITTLEDQFICAAWTNGVVDILSQRMGTPVVRWQAHTRAVAKLQFISNRHVITACVGWKDLCLGSCMVPRNRCSMLNTQDLQLSQMLTQFV